VKAPVPNSRISIDGASATWRALPRPARLRLAFCAAWVVALTAVYLPSLTELVQVSLQDELNSYIPLIPFVAVYLWILQRKEVPASYGTSVVGTVVLCLVGIAAAVAAIRLGPGISANDRLALTTLSYVAILAAGGFLFLGYKWMAAGAFPVSLLIFLVPLPDAAVHQIETASVQASADVSAWFFRMTGTPLLRDGTILALPGITLRVAQECSGIHSSWILFITSLVAAHLFLRNRWRRLALVAFVFPLAIIRNSFRILVIGMLSVHIGPEMIDSYIHRQGGPIFFALSLIPLFGLLIWLRRQEQ
jgi:exosortase C (VPDSG-CTERM-specific)